MLTEEEYFIVNWHKYFFIFQLDTSQAHLFLGLS